MERDQLLARLQDVARSRGFPADAETHERMLRYLEAVLEKGRVVNLTAARDLESAVRALALSSLAVTTAVDDAPRRVIDLGTGNGLPGVAASLAWPDAEVLLVERRGKKADAVRACVAALGLANTSVLTGDGREVLGHRPDLAAATDLVTVRAVGPLGEIATVAAPWLAPGGRIAHWKGRRLGADEIEEGRIQARRLGLRVLPLATFDDDAGPGHLVLYERPRHG